MTIEELKTEQGLPVILVGGDGGIVYVNPSFEKTFGWSMKEILGKPLTTIIPGNLHDAHNLGFSRFLMTEKPTLLNQPLKLKALRKDGTEFDAEHIIIAERSGPEWIFGATVRPLSP